MGISKYTKIISKIPRRPRTCAPSRHGCKPCEEVSVVLGSSAISIINHSLFNLYNKRYFLSIDNITL